MKRTALKRKSPLRAKTKPTGQSKLAKKSKVKISVLKRKLWEVFSKYIKQRDKQICFTCGARVSGVTCHAGHFIPKSVGGILLYFHEMNVHCQCYRCNINLGGFGSEYAVRLEAKYGKPAVEQLRSLRYQTAKWTVEDYQEKIAHYANLLES